MESKASIQLIVFGARNREDFGGVLGEVAQAGFPAIECGNLFATVGESETRRLLADHGLSISGVHFGYAEYEDAERIGNHIAFCKAMGIRHMMCSGVSDRKSAEGYRLSSRLFNEVGRRLKKEGLVFNYHNHDWEFVDLGGINGMRILEQETDPEVVKFNIDVFWVNHAGEDPAAFIRSNANRAGYFHFKDGTKNPDGSPVFLELGRGVVDLKSAMAAAREVGAEWIVAEQDKTELFHLESVTISREYMRRELGV